MHLVRLTFLFLLLICARFVWADDFVENIDSVPMIVGFDVNSEEGFFCDKPEGRMASAFAYGKKSPQFVIAYYRRILPDFGWQEVKPYLFLKNGEYLMIEPSKMTDFTMIAFFNFPKID